MKITNKYAQLLLSGIALSALPLSAQTTLWNDSFDGATIDSNWSTGATGVPSSGAAPAQSGGQITFSAGNENQFSRSAIGGSVSQAGDSLFNGNPIYNFFEHDLAISLGGLSIPGTVTSGSVNYFLEISQASSIGNATPRQSGKGFFMRLQKEASATRLIFVEKGATSNTTVGFFGMTDVPDSINLNLSSTGWELSILGATFTAGGTSRSENWSNITSSLFDGENPLYLNVGAQNFDVPTATDYSVSMGSLQIAAIPEPSATAALFGGVLGLFVLMRRRRR